MQEKAAATPQRRPKYGNSIYNRRQKAIALASAVVAEQLNEPNTAAVARLMEIFGEAFVRNMASDARRRFDDAAALGSEAYKPQPKGSDVATYTGAPRSAGGVFFYLLREHATALGLDWYGLRIPAAPRDQAPEQAEPEPSKTVVKTGTSNIPQSLEAPDAPTSKPLAAIDTIEQKKDSAKAQPKSDMVMLKPNRIKATVVGTPLGAPKPTDQLGVLQLVFDVEMTPTMPKGLPTLGRGRVIVLCTEKQYRQAQIDNGVPGRMIVEGEASTTLSTAGKPLLLVVCTRITTPEIEAAKRGN